MKTLPLFLLAGFAIGWWLFPGPEDRPDPGGARPIRETTRIAGSKEQRDGGGLSLSGGRIVPAPDKLAELMEMDGSPRLLAEYFDEGAPPGPRGKALDLLANWLDLDDEEKLELTAILREAVQDRYRWEKEHVRVETVMPGKWILHVPGDRGAEKRDLKAKLETAFGPEKAETIRLGAGLDGFFDIFSLDDLLVKGSATTISAIRTDQEMRNDPSGELLRLFVSSSATGVHSQMFLPMGNATAVPGSRHLLHLLGSEAEIAAAATANTPVEADR